MVQHEGARARLGLEEDAAEGGAMLPVDAAQRHACHVERREPLLIEHEDGLRVAVLAYEQPGALDTSVARRAVECRLAALRPLRDARARLEQRHEHVRVAERRRPMQRSVALEVAAQDVGLRRERKRELRSSRA